MRVWTREDLPPRVTPQSHPPCHPQPTTATGYGRSLLGARTGVSRRPRPSGRGSPCRASASGRTRTRPRAGCGAERTSASARPPTRPRYERVRAQRDRSLGARPTSSGMARRAAYGVMSCLPLPTRPRVVRRPDVSREWCAAHGARSGSPDHHHLLFGSRRIEERDPLATLSRPSRHTDASHLDTQPAARRRRRGRKGGRGRRRLRALPRPDRRRRRRDRRE